MAVIQRKRAIYNYKAADYKYDHSPKGRARQARYRKSVARKACQLRYARTEKGKLTRKRYDSKPAVREHIKWMLRSYRNSKRIRSMKL